MGTALGARACCGLDAGNQETACVGLLPEAVLRREGHRFHLSSPMLPNGKAREEPKKETKGTDRYVMDIWCSVCSAPTPGEPSLPHSMHF